MKAIDLMIGDWVKFQLDVVLTGQDGTETVIDFHDVGKVSVLDGIGNVRVTDNKGHEYQVTEDKIEPIPLTPEILKRIGFSLESFSGDVMNGNWWESPDFLICESMWDSVGKNNFRWNYIHQLQHAFKLCGIEREIIL